MKRRLSSLIFTGLLFVGCGEESGDGQAEEVVPGNVDTSGLVNSVDEKGLQTKGAEAKSVYEDMEKKIASVNNQQSLNFVDKGSDINKLVASLVETAKAKADYESRPAYGTNTSFDLAEEEAETIDIDTETETETTVETENGLGGNVDDLQFSGTFTDCSDGIDELKNFYKEGKDALADGLASLEDPENPEGDFASYSAYMKMEKVEKEGTAVAYKFVNKSDSFEGFSMSGEISGKASDTIIVIENKFEMAIDFSKITGAGTSGGTVDGVENTEIGGDNDTEDLPDDDFNPFELVEAEEDSGQMSIEGKIEMSTDMTVKADLAAELIDFSMDMTSKFGDQEMKAKAYSAVTGGDKPSVEWKSEGEASGTKFSAEMKMEFVDDNSIKISGKSDAGEGAKEYEITLKKAADGQCAVEM